MNKGIVPVGYNVNSPAFKKNQFMRPIKSIDTAYAEELKAIKKNKIDNDVFQRLNPEERMQNAKNKIQIILDGIQKVK